MTFDVGVGYLGQGRGLPARLVVLVDDHSAHAFVEIMAADDTRDYAEFRLHALAEVPILAAANLRQSELETQWRFGPDRGCRAARPFGMFTALLIEPGENVFDTIAGEQSVNGGTTCGNRSLT